MRKTVAGSVCASAREITIEPVTRIEGHARIGVRLDESGNVAEARVHIMSMRGFEKFIEGRAAEEIPGIVTRICGICPWQHHLASNKAVDGCFGIEVPPGWTPVAGAYPGPCAYRRQSTAFLFSGRSRFFRRFSPICSQEHHGNRPPGTGVGQKSYSDAVSGSDDAREVRRQVDSSRRDCARGLFKADEPPRKGRVVRRCRRAARICPICPRFCQGARFSRFNAELMQLGEINTGFLAMVNPEDGGLLLSDGILRLMRPDGSFQEFSCREYADFIGEHIEPWTYAKFPYARGWGEGFSMDLDAPRGIYRTNCLARINVAEFYSNSSRPGRVARISLALRAARAVNHALPLGAPDRTFVCLREGHRASRGPANNRPVYSKRGGRPKQAAEWAVSKPRAER